MSDLPYLRAEIERMRRQLQRQRKEIRDLQRAGIPTAAAEELLERMLTKVYRRILRGADHTHRHWVALEEEKCTGQNFHTLRNFCGERGLSLSPHGHFR